MSTRVNFVGFQNFVDHAHGQPSLAKPEKARDFSNHHARCGFCFVIGSEKENGQEQFQAVS
jgi:hypothetical protein